jgi:hypothetical protein
MGVDRGFAGKLAYGDATASMTGLLDVISEGLQTNYSYGDFNGVKGTRARNIAVTKETELPAGGPLVIQPRSGELTYLLPKITGDTSPAGGVHKLQETLPSTFFLIKQPSSRTTLGVHTYTGVQVGRSTFSCARGSPLTLAMETLALSETTASTFPSGLTYEYTDPLFMFHHLGTFSLAGTSYEIFNWQLSIDHVLNFRAINSRTTTQIYPTDRIVTLQVTIPYGDVTFASSNGLLTGPFADVAGVASVSTFTSGSEVLTFTIPKVRFTHATPIMQRGEIMYQLAGQCYMSGQTALTDQEVDITLTDG